MDVEWPLIIGRDEPVPPHSFRPLTPADRGWYHALDAYPDDFARCYQLVWVDGAQGLCALFADDPVHRC